MEKRIGGSSGEWGGEMSDAEVGRLCALVSLAVPGANETTATLPGAWLQIGSGQHGRSHM